MSLEKSIKDLDPQSVLKWQFAALDAGYMAEYMSPEDPEWDMLKVIATFDDVRVGKLPHDNRLLAMWSEDGMRWRQELPMSIAWDWHLIEDPREH